MEAEKTLSGMMRALPPLLCMEETKGLGRTFKQQWGGGGNTARIVYKIFTGGQGFLKNMRAPHTNRWVISGIGRSPIT